MLMTNEDIIAAYLQIKPDGPAPFIFHWDKHTFIMTEFTWKGFSAHLKLAEAFPGIGKEAPPLIELQTKIQLEKQIRVFVDSHEDAT